jgi:polyisoprenoid-binding protein YceI
MTGTMSTSDTSVFSPIRVVDGQALPIAGTWVIDALHSSVGFEARHMAVTRMHGRFRSFRGQIVVADTPEESSFEVSIETASLDTTNDAADQSLKSDRFLDVETYPLIQFRSTGVRYVERDLLRIDGDLTIKGVTRPIELAATFEGAVPALRGVRAKLAFSARAEFDRRDYGIDFNLPIPGGGWVVGNRVNLTLDVEADLP